MTNMDAQTRRDAVARRLENSTGPVSATVLAGEFGVSRQIIVGDIALLRASGADIIATPRGYIIPHAAPGILRKLATCHGADRTEDELNAMVDQGCTVVDVTVDHPIYGQLTGALNLSNRYDVAQFVLRCRQEAAAPLSTLTEGVHLHTLLCPNETAFARVRDALRAMGILVEG